MNVKVLAVTSILLLAGCSGQQPTTPTAEISSPTLSATLTAQDTPTETAKEETPTDVPTPTASPTPSPTPTPPEAMNPWGKAPVTVAISKPTSTNRDFRPLVQQTLTYWETNAANYTTYDIEYEVINSTENADIVVNFVDRIGSCGYESNESVLGCAPLLVPEVEPDEQTDVRIETGYSDNGTLLVLKHEFGHTLGLDHSANETLPFMAAAGSVAELPMKDLKERDYKWENSTISVYVDPSVAVDSRHDYIRREVKGVRNYYNREKINALPENFSLRMVDEKEKADIVVQIVEETPNGRFSDIEALAVDPDIDGRQEFMSSMTIYVRDEHHDEIGNEVGFWMAWALYADSYEEIPSVYK